MQRDAVDDVFGLAGTFPRPGWVVLDAARELAVTGELYFETVPPVRVYFDRGQIYLAERVTDPSLGARLVDAGALTAVQLERGAIRIGDIEHLGHLFERVPDLDRHTVVVTAELMTEECVGWVAAQRVPEATWTPYRHHESGTHRWTRSGLEPGAPLPAPPVGEAPVSVTPPLPEHDRVGDHTEPLLDGLIEWDEPSWLDGAGLDQPRAVDVRTLDDDTADAPSSEQVPDAETSPLTDWVDLLATNGLPDADPLAAPRPLPRLPVEPIERFELVWPSGEIDDEFGAVDSVAGNGHDPDADRVGATARLGRSANEPAPSTPPSAPDARTDDEQVDDQNLDTSLELATDEVVLAVRRAVASIDVGSLAARQRLADRTEQFGHGTSADDGHVAAPGRVAVRSGRNDWSRRTVTRSVFDEVVVEQPDLESAERSVEPDEHRDRRAGALRRLIASLRR